MFGEQTFAQLRRGLRSVETVCEDCVPFKACGSVRRWGLRADRWWSVVVSAGRGPYAAGGGQTAGSVLTAD